MKVKTSELQGEALDWAVAKCEFPEPDYEPQDWLVYITEDCMDDGWVFKPSTDWAQGGPIIERERLKIVYFASSQEWNVSKLRYRGLCEPHDIKGPSLLVAAMRCYVASKLGDEVEIPEELK
jgi:hypothetical protein